MTTIELDIDGIDERAANEASVAALLAPRSIAVIVGPGHSSPIERLLLTNIVGAGFTGSVYTVGPDRGPSAAVPSVSALAQLPTTPDLAIITGPARDVIAHISECGRVGVKAVIVQSAALVGSRSARQQLGSEQRSAARRYGMRLLGPGCAGVLNTDPEVRLNATVATTPMLAGGLGLVAQSSELGLAVLLAAAASGVGVSQFVTAGGGLDVGENDLLLRWANDPGTQVVGLLLNELDDAERFAAIARQVTGHLAVIAFVPTDRFGRSGITHATSHSGAVRAVLRSSGVHVVATTQELIESARRLSACAQPTTGPRSGPPPGTSALARPGGLRPSWTFSAVLPARAGHDLGPYAAAHREAKLSS